MYRVIIVDDEIMSRDVLSDYIEAQMPDFSITHRCGNGREALEAFERQPVDIVLADIRMPVMDGLSLIEALNRISQDYVPIIISSYGEFAYAKTSMRLGVIHYLLKPLDFKELRECLEAAAHSLRLRRLTHSHITLYDDDQELYLIRLLTGGYADTTAAREDFAGLRFPFPYNSCRGTYLQLTFSPTESWTYGRDALLTALNNLMHLLYAPLYLLPLFRKETSCHYLLIASSPEELRPEELLEQSRQLLHTDCRVESMTRFTSLEQLRTSPPARSQPQAKSVSSLPPSENSSDAMRLAIQTAIAYMREHCAEDLTREDVAGRVYMSGAHFSRCFKLVTHSTYKDYLTEIRMLKAIELLKTSERIQAIAQQVGYTDPYRFSVSFRHYTSYTPSEYRSKVLKII